MHSFQDPSKKTSITSLLNPPTADATTSYPHTPGGPSRMSSSAQGAVNQRQQQPHVPHVPAYTHVGAHYANTASFHLRAAHWGGLRHTMPGPDTSSPHHYRSASGFSSDRRPEPPSAASGVSASKQNTQSQSSRPIHQHQISDVMPASDGYPKSQGPPMGRLRATSIQSMTDIEPGRVWRPSSAPANSIPYTPPRPPAHPEPANNIPYGPPRPPTYPESRHVSNSLQSQSQSPDSDAAAISPQDQELTQSQSEPRSSLASQNKRVAGYQHSGAGRPQVAEYQISERASVRVAARGVMGSPAPPQSQVVQAPSYYVAAAGSPHSTTVVTYPAIAPSPRLQEPSSQEQASETAQSVRVISASSKRPLSESEAYASTPKAKRPAKAKPKVGSDAASGPSRRGFNAKKRSEAAQIAAQNAQMTATASMSGDQGKGKATDSRSPASSQGAGPRTYVPELQFARCMSNRYKKEDFHRCVSCTRRWAGDTCRFQGIRCFMKDENQEIVGMSFMSAKANDVPALQFPTVWNVPLKQEHIDQSKKVIAKSLLSTLKAEREHLNLDDLIRRARESDVRVTCDTCMTSIFSSSWMCRLCGREACADCFAQVRDLTEDRPGATHAELAEMQKKREKNAHSNPFFLSCTRRNEHQVNSFSPMSRFFPDELDEAIKEMEEIAAADGEEQTGHNEVQVEDINGAPLALPSAASSSGHDEDVIVVGQAGPKEALEGIKEREELVNWRDVFKSKEIAHEYLPQALQPSGATGESYLPPTIPESVTITPYYRICRFTDEEVTAFDSFDKFAKIWAHGEPIVVANILHKFKIDWSPEYFIQEFGDRECLIVECEHDTNKKTTIKDFFGQFGNYTDRKDVWKLKDWPPSADFKTAFPKLYKDFSDAVPVPDYVRRDGVYNIGSHFPSNVVAPDLGPKMYNAWASNQNPGSKGSTRLHMDMADAMNVMLYAAACPDGSPGCAVWDIYRAEDSEKIRSFLRKHAARPHYDPIHVQQYYLDDLLRSQLYKEYGVCSYRVYQRPGEAIFIPAGCAHQVSNMADSIKIAIDYVSPENINRCAQLTREFREQNRSKVWKEDILQLKNMMWYAWLSCSKQEKILRGEEEADEEVSAKRKGVDGSSSSSKKPKLSAGRLL